MMSSRTRRAAVVVAIAGLSVCAPAVSANAEASASPTPPDLGVAALDGGGPANCSSDSMDGVGKSGSIDNKICQGGGLVFVGPSTVIGPTIIGPTYFGAPVPFAGGAWPAVGAPVLGR
jgi:hypothetical protein